MGSISKRLAVALGDADPVRLRVWDTVAGTSTDVHSAAVSDTQITRGRTDATGDPAAPSMSTRLVDDGLTHQYAGLYQVLLSDAALDTIYGSHVSSAAVDAKIRYTGLLTDQGASVKASNTPRKLTIQCAGIRSRLGKAQYRWVGTFWGTRSDRSIAALVLQQAQFLNILTPTVNDYLLNFVWGVAGSRLKQPTTDTIAAGGFVDSVGGGVVKDTLDLLATSIGGTWDETRDARVNWLSPAARRESVSFDIPSYAVLDPAAATYDGSDVLNYLTVTYGLNDGDPLPAPSTAATNDASLARYGIISDAVDTKLRNLADAQNMALDQVVRFGLPRWRLSTITIDVLLLIEQGHLSLVRSLLSMETGQRVNLTGWPSDAVIGGGKCWVEGWTERISRGSYRLDLAVIGWDLLAPRSVWNDVDAGLTWNAVPAELTWQQASMYRGN